MVSLRITIPNQKPQANKKFFDPAIFQKCWRGVGEQPTFAEQIVFETVATYEPQATKSFLIQQFFKNAGEVWASSPHLRSKLDFAICFPAAIALFKAFKFKQSCIMRIKVVNSSKATGQLQHAGRQKQGWNPLLPDVEDRFP